MTAPEPWREVPPTPSDRRRGPQNPQVLARDQGRADTEFGYGAGLVAPHLNGAPPSEGGIYMGKSPRVDPPASGFGPPRQHRRPRGEAKGYPGEKVVS